MGTVRNVEFREIGVERINGSSELRKPAQFVLNPLYHFDSGAIISTLNKQRLLLLNIVLHLLSLNFH